MIWDVETGKKIKKIDAVGDGISSIVKLPQENLCLILAEDGFFRLDITTEKSEAEAIYSVVWRDIKTDINNLYQGGSQSVHLLSANRLVLGYERQLIVTTIDNLFECIELDAQNSQSITDDDRCFTQVCVLPNDYIACITENQGSRPRLIIYDLNQKKFVFEFDLLWDAKYELLLLADQRILLCNDNEIVIIPFAARKNNVIKQEDPENEHGEARSISHNPKAQ